MVWFITSSRYELQANTSTDEITAASSNRLSLGVQSGDAKGSRMNYEKPFIL